MARRGIVYYTCIPKLWALRDDDGDCVADQRIALHDGYGVRVAFRGHDLHGLCMGPDGRLYFSIGDRGYNVLTKEGLRLANPDSGAVFRCNLDGSHLEVIATGLRNPWVEGWEGPGKGRIYRIENPRAAHDPQVKEVKRMISEGMSGRAVEQLTELLDHRDRRIRLEAQFELVQRQEGSQLARVAKSSGH